MTHAKPEQYLSTRLEDTVALLQELVRLYRAAEVVPTVPNRKAFYLYGMYVEVYKDHPEWGSEVVWPSRMGHLQSGNLRVFMADVLRRFW